MFFESREARIDKSTFKLIPAAPRQIDLTTIFAGKDESLQTKAIYHADDKHLEYCVAPPGQPRPTEFTTRLGDDLTLAKLRRVKSTGNP